MKWASFIESVFIETRTILSRKQTGETVSDFEDKLGNSVSRKCYVATRVVWEVSDLNMKIAALVNKS